MEHTNDQLCTIVRHLDSIDDYETWKIMAMTVARTLTEYPSEPLLDVIFDRAKKLTTAVNAPSLKDTMRKLMVETQITLSIEEGE